jgi:hypothetical protein
MILATVLAMLLLLSGCATCDYEATHAFMKRNNMEEVCYTIRNDDTLSGNYCLRRVK